MQDDTPPPKTRRERLWEAAEARHVPLRAILATVAVVALTYVAGKVVYRLRDVILLMVVAGFLALILNPLVLVVQRWGVRRRGLAVTVVTIWGLLVFAGLALAVRLPAGERDHPPGSHPAGLREQGGARPGLDRAPGAQVPRRGVGIEERTQADELRAEPGQTRAHPGQGGPLAAHRAADHLRAGPAPAAGGAEAAGGAAGDDGTGAGGALRAGGARGQPVGHRLHGREHPDVDHRRGGRVRDPADRGRPVSLPVGPVGGAGGLPAHDRRRAGGHSHRVVRRSLTP